MSFVLLELSLLRTTSEVVLKYPRHFWKAFLKLEVSQA